MLDCDPRPDFSGCAQVMRFHSPFTHTPVLQRCDLKTGQSESLQVGYI
jgi:hypothetical protein